MEIPPLSSGVGQYYHSLNLPYVCWSQDLALIRDCIGITAGLLKMQPEQKTLADCRESRFIFTVVPLVYIDRNKKRLTEGYTFLFFDTKLNTMEWVIPYILQLSPTYESAIRTALTKTNFSNYTFTMVRPQDLVSQEIKDAFFLTLYYLETRLTNMRFTKDQVLLALRQVTPEMVNQYRRKLIPFTYTENMGSNKKGIIFCHGQTHGLKSIPSWVPRDALWWTLDHSPDTKPQYVGSYDNMQTLQELGFFSWDYVLLQNCPIYNSRISIQQIIRAARWLLKPSGQLLFPKGTSATFFVIQRYGQETGYPGKTVRDFVKEYQAGKAPEVDEFYNKIKEEEFYSEYIPFNRRDVIMIV